VENKFNEKVLEGRNNHTSDIFFPVNQMVYQSAGGTMLVGLTRDNSLAIAGNLEGLPTYLSQQLRIIRSANSANNPLLDKTRYGNCRHVGVIVTCHAIV
jgi:hypothetical protein